MRSSCPALYESSAVGPVQCSRIRWIVAKREPLLSCVNAALSQLIKLSLHLGVTSDNWNVLKPFVLLLTRSPADPCFPLWCKGKP